jgi:hypothetical protein
MRVSSAAPSSDSMIGFFASAFLAMGKDGVVAAAASGNGLFAESGARHAYTPAINRSAAAPTPAGISQRGPASRILFGASVSRAARSTVRASMRVSSCA